jgi:hypothetical protein
MVVDASILHPATLHPKGAAMRALHVALAERLRVPLLTADAGIAGAPGLRCKVRLVKLEESP